MSALFGEKGAGMELLMSVLFFRAAGVGALLLCQIASAQPSDASVAAITLQDAIQRSLDRNLDLKAFGYELQAQEGRVQQARARPAPEISLLLENALGTGSRSSFDSAETTLSLGFLLEHGARQRRIDAAQAGSSLAETESHIRRLDTAAETARRYVAVLTAQRDLEEQRNATRFAQETLSAVQKRVRAAKAPSAEAARAHAQVARMRLDEEHAEHELASARHRLAALWGSTEADFGEAHGELLSLPTLEPFASLRLRLKGNPDFDRLVSEKRLREAELRLAETRGRPPWQVTAGVRRFEDAGDHAFIVGVTVPIAMRGQTRGAIAQARANSEQVDAKREALRVQLDAELFALYQELTHSYTEVNTLRTDVLPRMEEAVGQSRYAYERGRYSYIEWVAAQRELLEVRRALFDASADVHRRRIEIERLTGTTLSGRPAP